MEQSIAKNKKPLPEGKIKLKDFSSICVITIKRPSAHNAMTKKMWQDLKSMSQKIGSNPNTKVVILRGAFEYFTAGSDLKEFSQMSLEEADETFGIMEETISTVERLPIPTIACIKGSAMGAGLQLALACDLRVAADNALLGMPTSRLGITVRTPFAKRLVNMIGPSRAKDMLLTGKSLAVQEALDLGVVNYVTSLKNVERFALRLAKKIAYNSPASIQACKEAVAQCMPKTDVSRSTRTDPYWVDTTDFAEGVNAFIEKRLPDFKRIRIINRGL